MIRKIGLSFVALLLIAAGAQAQAPWPTKPVKILVPTAPGGTADATGAHVRAAPGQGAGPAVLRREPRRRRQHARHRLRGPLAGRRLHAAARRRHHHHQSSRLQEAAVRRAARSHAGDPDDLGAERAGGASVAADEDAGGLRRRGQGGARPAQLWLGRRRQQSSPGDGAAQVPDRHRGHARALQGRRPGAAGHARRPRHVDGLEHCRRPSRTSTPASSARSPSRR